MKTSGPVFRSIGVSRLRMGRDGDGVTTLVAGYGCPLRCRYCLNPQCFASNGPAKTYTVSELLDEVSIDDLYFKATEGGVVFGGGEPLLYAGFIHEFKKACPPEWKIGLESSLSTGQEALKMVLSDIDYFIIDIKDMDPDIYRSYTGKSNENTLNNLRLLIDNADPSHITVRLPLIPSFNTRTDMLSSRSALEEMGFTTFDEFRYNVERSEIKRGNAVCSRKDQPTE